jgi:hypothetical protein
MARKAQRKALGECSYGRHPTTPGYASCVACRARYGRGAKTKRKARARDTYERKVPTSQRTRRECLRCDRTFDSWGKGNRLCPACGHNRQKVDLGPGARPLPDFMHEIVNGWRH